MHISDKGKWNYNTFLGIGHPNKEKRNIVIHSIKDQSIMSSSMKWQDCATFWGYFIWTNMHVWGIR